MEDLHTRSVDHFAARGEHATQQGACPLETWARDLNAYVNAQVGILASIYQLSADEARGMALAGLVSGRPGSWEAAEVIAMARARFAPLVSLDQDETAARSTAGVVGEWHTWQIDGGQVVADALARLVERGAPGPVIPYGSYFAGTSFAISTTI